MRNKQKKFEEKNEESQEVKGEKKEKYNKE
jgi:hypothetical protein